LGKVETEEEALDSIAHLDVIAADGGIPPAPNIEPKFSPSPQDWSTVTKQREHGNWRKLRR
jgi:hypothetical protein